MQSLKRILRPSLRNLIGRKSLVGVEIGVFIGLNSKTILESLDIKKMYLVDPYSISPTYKDFHTSKKRKLEASLIKEAAHKLLVEYKDKLIWVENSSDPKIEEVLDFVYTDGDHTYDGVMKDLTTYYNLIKSDGLIGGHDFDQETDGNQVRRAVYDFFTPLKKEVFYDYDPYDPRTMDWWVFK